MENPQQISKPPDSAIWSKNSIRSWPRLMYENLVDYFITNKAYDGKEMRAFRSLYGKNYVDSGWLGDVHDCHEDTGVCYLKSVVSPSQPGVGRKDYETWAAVKESDCTIITGHCTCPAGAGRTCSHISAMLYAVVMEYKQGTAGESCTDKPRACGTQLCSQILSVHEPFTELVIENHKRDCDDNISKPKQFLDHKDMVHFVKQSSVKSLWECKGTLLNQILTALERVAIEKQPLNHGDHEVPTDIR